MGKRESEIRNKLGPEGLMTFLADPVVDSIRFGMNGSSNIKMDSSLPNRTYGFYRPRTNQIGLNAELDLNPRGNNRYDAPLVVLHETLHERYNRNKTNPEADPEYNELFTKLQNQIRALPVDVIAQKANMPITRIPRHFRGAPLGVLDSEYGLESNMIDTLTDEYIAYLGTYVFHNLRRNKDNPELAYQMATMVEEKYPGTVALTNYLSKNMKDVTK